MSGESSAWHAYISHYESVHAVSVMAASAALAAVEAARATGIAGRWTVVHGTAVEIDVIERRDFAWVPGSDGPQ